ncbi:MAG: hypothetical protein AAF995_03420 [Planctomycetota bacterium]
MAGRGGAGVGVVVTITLLILFTVIFFVTTMVFFGQASRAKSDLRAAQENIQQFVSPGELNQDSTQALVSLARDQRESVTAYLTGALRDTMEIASGDRGMTVENLRVRISDVAGEGQGDSLLGLLRSRNAEIASLNEALAQAEDDRRKAIATAEAEAARVAEIESDFESRYAALQGDVQNYGDIVAGVESGHEAVAQRLRDEVSRAEDNAQDRLDEAQQRADALAFENEQLKFEVAELRGLGFQTRVTPRSEEALVDGRIDRVNTIDDEVILSIGRGQKVILGMTFAVYRDASSIRIDPETGEYRSGKAVVEVVRVEENFSRARIIESSEGDPIVRGDIVANAVYDPSKTYTFVVYGMFDRDGDGVPTLFERDDVESLVARWGGEVVDDIRGDLDFVILGERPSLPPAPGPGSSIEAVLEYARLQEVVAKYDELFGAALSTSVPILNQNRLETLIGRFPE